MSRLSYKIILPALLLFFMPFFASADCSQNNTLDIVVRDPSGGLIANARVEVYKQELDANGQPKPTSRVASATTSANLGSAHLSWHNSADSDTYALKIWTVNKDAASFWYYDFVFACGQSASLEETLSGIAFHLFDPDGRFLSNTNFTVYSQLYDSNNNALAQKKEALATLNSGLSGSATIYLPQGSVRSLDRSLSDDYAFELSYGGFKFVFYGLHVTDEQLTTVNYYLSALRVKLQDTTGALYPANTKVEIFQQTIDANNNPAAGAKIGDFLLGSDGYGQITIPAGVYTLGVKGQNSQYQYFYNVEAIDGRVSEYTLTPSAGWLPPSGACSTNSRFILALRDFTGEITPGLKFDLYEQATDVNGLPYADKRVSGGTIDASGQADLVFKPDPRKAYALKVWDKRADVGEFWFFDAVRFVCGYDRQLTEYVPALKIILRDAQGNLKKNYSFSLYAQSFDADLKPILENSDLVTNLSTNTSGQAVIYVAPYNPYRRGQTGFYGLKIKDASGNYAVVYNLEISPVSDYTFSYSLSSFSGELRDARGVLTANKEVRLYEEINDGGNLSLGKLLLKTKTDSGGHFYFEYPAGTYALALSDSFNQDNVFWNAVFSGENGATRKLVTNLTDFSLADTQGELLPSDTSLKLYSLNPGNGNNFFRAKEVGNVKLASDKTAALSLAAGPYLILYQTKGGQEYGRAFYAQNGQEQKISVIIGKQYLLTANQAFPLSVPALSQPVPATSNGAAPTPTAISSALSLRLKGRILLQVQAKGEAWYVNPVDGERYYLGRPLDAFNLMCRFGLGVSNQDLATFLVNPPQRLAGRILLKVQDKGQAYYLDPVSLKFYYLGAPAQAFQIIRSLGLGITNGDLAQIASGD